MNLTLKQIAEMSQSEIKGTQAENGKYVGGEHNERVAADTEHSGNAVHGECDIGGLNNQQRHQQWSGLAPSVLGYEETVTMHLVGYGIEPAKPSHDDILRRVGLLVVIVPKHPGTCIKEE